MKAQGSLEYLIIIAAVLVVAGVVAMLVTGSTISKKDTALVLSCQAAAKQCALLKKADFSNECDFCVEQCLDQLGEQVVLDAINCCKIGNSDAIYEGSVEICEYVSPVPPVCNNNGICDAGETTTNCINDCPPPDCTDENVDVDCPINIYNYDDECVAVSCPIDECGYDTSFFEGEDCDGATGTCQSGFCIEKSESCGNGQIEGSEECDDSNSISWDGCENDCTDSLIVTLKNFEASDAYGNPDNTWVVFVSEDYAYVSDQYTGLRVFDVGDKSDPSEVGFFDYYSFIGDIFVQGDYAYLTSMEAGGGLVIIDVSDKSDLLVVDEYNVPSVSVFVSGDYAYLGGSYGLKVIDVSDKSDLSVVGSYRTSDYIGNIFVSGDYVYASTIFESENVLYIFDISDPTSLNEVGSYIASVNGIFVEV